MRLQRLNQTQSASASSTVLSEAAIKPPEHPVMQLQATIGSHAASQCITVHPRTPDTRQPIQAKPIFRGLYQELASEMSEVQTTPLNKHDQGTGQSTGNNSLPSNMKARIERLCGISMDGVKVHYNSAQPIQMLARAYTQGDDIYIGPGQEKYLPHEAWHVVQQKQGRVRGTIHLQGLPINDEPWLEREADNMAARIAVTTTNEHLHPTAAEYQGNKVNDYSMSPPNKDEKPIIQQAVYYSSNARGQPEYKMQKTSVVNAVKKEIGNDRTEKYVKEIDPIIDTVIRSPDKILLSKVLKDIKDIVEKAETVEKRKIEKTKTQIEENKAKREEDVKRLLHPEYQTPVVGNPTELHTEGKTRFGYEMETGGHLKVNPKFGNQIEGYVNQALAKCKVAEDLVVEMVIDDYNPSKKEVQVEFRTAPINSERITTAKLDFANVQAAIQAFPISKFAQKGQEKISKKESPKPKMISLSKSLKKEDQKMLLNWELTPIYGEIGQWLSTVGSDKPKSPTSVQHVTHSLPLAGFLKLDKADKNLLLPESGEIKEIVELIAYFYGKLQAEIHGEILYISTTGRNRTSPNCKTPLDILIGMLDEDKSEDGPRKQILNKIQGSLPRLVVLGSHSSDEKNPSPYIGKLPNLETSLKPEEIRTLGVNTEGERGYLGSEEKPRLPFLDTDRRDVRVLVEHRSGPLVKALNDAIHGKNIQLLKEFQIIFQKLDQVEGDKLFERWFNSEAKQTSQVDDLKGEAEVLEDKALL
ncbi:DUF4157 domain-containing protein [Trichocoleus sp. FACHB-591]|uniref:eCIS core domain-containing protein n=1 Tax=Trichocoleus sp. FACHB-591 TaxID=2692872 RepID=UPI0018EFDF36|nr:DUF4157 domain-containing protein [Trichocoleus sp. FACHB-591]